MKTSTKTTAEHDITVRRQDILAFIRGQGRNAPDDAHITVRVPGGGDWSNCDLEIDEERDIHVRFSERI